MEGKIISITSDVIDVQFSSDKVPAIGTILKTATEAILSVEMILKNSIVRTIIISSKEYIAIGEKVFSTGKGIMAPVGKATLGRIFNVMGETIDNDPINKKIKYEEVKINKKLQKSFIMTNQLMETGIKIIDFFTPIFKGNKIGTFGGAGVGKTVIMKEIINNISSISKKSNSIFVGIGERSREGEEMYRDLAESNLLDKVVLFFSQMCETPGSRMKIIYSSITTAEYFRDNLKEDVFMFIDNIFRFTQAGSEVSSLLGKIPSQSGYQPTLVSEISNIQERMSNNANGSISSFQTIFAPADDITDPSTLAAFSHLNSSIVLDRELAALGKHPAMNPLTSSSSNINEELIGKEHYQAVMKSKTYLQRFDELEDLITVLGVSGLSTKDQIIVKRSRQLSNFFTQNFKTAEEFTHKKGDFVSLKDTIRSVQSIINGELDDIEPTEFLYISTVDHLLEKVKQIKKDKIKQEEKLDDKFKKIKKNKKNKAK